MPDSHKMPERVRELIAAHEAGSERLIGWVQLAVGVVMAMLFFLSPRPADAPMAMYEPVPIALAAYALFTVGRLLVSYRGQMPAWLVVLSILLDVALLIGLIWSFHIQYAQPASFALQVPTFIFLFVFIALRALRFDHRYVLLSGATAAVGWLGLFLYADLYREGTVTRSFVEYVNGNAILRGAEVEKILIILLITAILGMAIWRARTTLVTAVRESSASREMSRFLSKGLAAHITEADNRLQPGEAAERDAAVLMIDIRGFTAFASRNPPQDVVHMLTGYHARVLPIIERHGGVVDKFLGDGVMATFGAITPSTTAAADALRALEEIVEDTQAWRAEVGNGAAKPRNGEADLDVNAAVAAGRVVFATLGDAERLEYTVIGPAVNLAAKLEKHNKLAKSVALTPSETLEIARRQGYKPAMRQRVIRHSQVAGVRKPMDLTAIEPTRPGRV